MDFLVERWAFQGLGMDKREKEFAEMIGQKIRELRDAAGLDNAALATHMNLSPAAVAAWARGEGVGNFVKLSRLAAALHSSPNEILGYRPEEATARLDLDAIAETFAGAVQSLSGLGPVESSELAALILRDAVEPLDAPAGADSRAFRRSLAGVTARRFAKLTGGRS